MGKRKWTVTLRPRPTSDGQERLVRALRMIAESAPSRTAVRSRTPRADGLDEAAERRMDQASAGQALAKEKGA